MAVNMHIYAAASYIKKHGVPQTNKDLDEHRIVVYGEDVRPPVPDVNWLLRVGYKDGQLRRATMTVNNVYGVMKAVQSGAGVGALPEFMAASNPDLVQVQIGRASCRERVCRYV